jgi:YD repeat-containing protein
VNRIAIWLLTLLLSGVAFAEVNPRDGNFYVTYEDIAFSGDGPPLNVRRTYNSISAEQGWFGIGWGSPYETQLVVMLDGAATVIENGTGGLSHYRPDTSTQVRAEGSALAEADGQHVQLGDSALIALKSPMRGDADQRLRLARQYGMVGSLAFDALLRDPRCRDATLKRTVDGYRRVTCSGIVDDFDGQGRLVRRSNANGYQAILHYDTTRPTHLTDTAGRRLDFKWNSRGLLTHILTNDGREATYRYGKNGTLIESVDAHGLPLKYAYDQNDNLTTIAYIDGTSIELTYGDSSTGRIATVTERTGERKDYHYTLHPVTGEVVATRIRVTSVDGDVSESRVMIKREHSQNGALQTITLESEQSSKSGGPSNHLNTKVDPHGRVMSRLDNEGRRVDYVYHPHTGRLILVLGNSGDYMIRYDERGRMTEIISDAGQHVELRYGTCCRKFERVIEHSKGAPTRELVFRYNADGKPEHVRLVGTGSVSVRYDAQGEVEHVHAEPGGPRMALQIMQVLKSLLQVIRVTRVDQPL